MTENNFPKDLKYNKDYSWIKIEKETTTVGVIESATKKVKEFVFIKLPEKGKKISQGEKYVSLEAVKWSGHLSSPVSGEIIDVNDSLFAEPSKINKDPYESWIMKVRVDNTKDLEELMDPEEATKFYEKKLKGGNKSE